MYGGIEFSHKKIFSDFLIVSECFSLSKYVYLACVTDLRWLPSSKIFFHHFFGQDDDFSGSEIGPSAGGSQKGDLGNLSDFWRKSPSEFFLIWYSVISFLWPIIGILTWLEGPMRCKYLSRCSWHLFGAQNFEFPVIPIVIPYRFYKGFQKGFGGFWSKSKIWWFSALSGSCADLRSISTS